MLTTAVEELESVSAGGVGRVLWAGRQSITEQRMSTDNHSHSLSHLRVV